MRLVIVLCDIAGFIYFLSIIGVISWQVGRLLTAPTDRAVLITQGTLPIAFLWPFLLTTRRGRLFIKEVLVS